MSSYCTVFLARHGETAWNREGILQGHTNIPLNSNGENQAKKLQQKLIHENFVAIFSSDLARAQTTAAIIAEPRKLEVETTQALRERGFGSWEGKSLKQFDKWYAESKDSIQENSDIESIPEAYSRAAQFICAKAVNFLGQSILIATHGGIIDSFLDKYKKCDPKIRWEVENCAYLKLHIDSKSDISIVDVNGITEIKMS